MTQMHCDYRGDRDETLIAYLYDDIDPAARGAFETHLAGCATCQDEIQMLRGVRTSLARWNPPEPKSPVVATQQPTINNQQWWRTIPAWAQVAAALLFLGVAAGIANLDVRYDGHGLAVHTGWSKPAVIPTQPPVAAEVSNGALKSDLTALEQRLRAEIRAVQNTPATVAVRPSNETAIMRKVRSLVDEAERRQQRELALRIAQAITDVNAARQADLRRIDHSLSGVQDRLGIEVLKNRQQVQQVLLRVNQRQ